MMTDINAPKNNIILYCNIKHIDNRIPLIQHHLRTESPSILILVETHHRTLQATFPNYNVYEYNVDISYSGVIVLINKSTITRNLRLTSNNRHDCVSFEITQNNTNIKVEAHYVSPNTQLQIQRLNSDIILGDFNSKHPIFNNLASNPNGKILAKTVKNERLNVLNDNTPTYTDRSTGSTDVLDLILTNNKTLNKIENTFLSDDFNSDHVTINVVLKTSPPPAHLIHLDLTLGTLTGLATLIIFSTPSLQPNLAPTHLHSTVSMN